MLMEGKSVRVAAVENGIYELVFDNHEDSVNKLNQATMAELREAITQLSATEDVTGLLISSAKDSFIVGADITEFTQMFSHSEEEIVAALTEMNGMINNLEDLPFPTVSVINGVALGGGFEVCLATDYRVAAEGSKVGLPEVKLGIYPGWGGTVRLSRLIGVDNANEWICGGVEKKADVALKEGAVDAVVTPEQLREAGLDLLNNCIGGKFDYKARRAEKQGPIKLNQVEQMMAFESAKGVIGKKAGPHYPAPLAALSTIQKHANLPRDKALAVEAKGFAKLATNSVTRSLVGLFMKDQYVKKVTKAYEAKAEPVTHAAVLGAGIMGGGIAFQSAFNGVPILMKTLVEPAVQHGLVEANKLLTPMVKRRKITAEEMATIINRIVPTLSYGDFDRVDLVVEAVVENEEVKKSVLAEAEEATPDNAVITSNTSTISINALAKGLKKPENFCGMHFFNPVHKMPLVEVIRGEQTSEDTIARTVAYAKTMGKTAIVVNDCPGFLVNRVLFPYFAGFCLLVGDGADFQHVDQVMEGFGWPMGPAYLLDVVGIDTCHHANDIMSEGYPDRMVYPGESALDRMYSLERYGQKNGLGFYRYETDRRGRPRKKVDESVPELLNGVAKEQLELTDQEIIERLMIPLCIETVRCLEEGIVASAAEADMGLIYGIGFPPFRGGPLHYLDQMGLAAFCEMAAKYEALGPLYQPTEKMKTMAANGETYF